MTRSHPIHALLAVLLPLAAPTLGACAGEHSTDMAASASSSAGVFQTFRGADDH